MDTFEKQDDKTLKVTTTISSQEVKTYDISFLKSQRAQILRDQERVARELADIDNLILQAESLGIVETPIEPPPISVIK